MKRLFTVMLVPIVGVALSFAVPSVSKAQDNGTTKKESKKKGKKKKKDDSGKAN
ncbi:MAG TPA: hypothetical protein VFA54_17340 [Bryobacterales bacterium]|jgi:hypothetical protein|nr:hypothetical protein [Bryobacterales bacterium]